MAERAAIDAARAVLTQARDARVFPAAVVDVGDSTGTRWSDAIGRLFEPFFSLKPHGTGLGLAIVKRTIEAHGGTIRASSASGMTFDIELPVVEDSVPRTKQGVVSVA